MVREGAQHQPGEVVELARPARLRVRLNGETERAATELAEARKLVAGNSYSSIARMNTWWVSPKNRALADATFFAGLREAGVPEE